MPLGLRLALVLCVLVCGGLSAVPARAALVSVSTSAQLIAAIDGAAPGDVITLAPGTYTVNQNLQCDNAGTAAQPITVRGATPGQVFIRFNAVEGFRVSAPHWVFEQLDIQGICPSHSACEHAFHIVGRADFTRVRNCRMRDFNAQIKGNGEGEPRLFPDDVVIESNELFNSTIRATSNPVTPIDIVGGRRWVIRGNFIHDFAKGQGDQISYAAFLKGNSRDGLFERNLVACERDHTGGIRLGLSFGGGGSGPPSICEDGTCTPEHQGGVMRNNVIANCPQDVGIYLNRAQDVGIYHNTLYNTTGIDVRFTATSADLRNNLLSGQIRNRDDGFSTEGANRESVTPLEWVTWFLNPMGLNFSLLLGTQLVDLGESLPEVPEDYCGNLRDDGAPDLGAVEYDGDGACDTTRARGGGEIFADGFESGGLAGWGLVLP